MFSPSCSASLCSSSPSPFTSFVSSFDPRLGDDGDSDDNVVATRTNPSSMAKMYCRSVSFAEGERRRGAEEEGQAGEVAGEERFSSFFSSCALEDEEEEGAAVGRLGRRSWRLTLLTNKSANANRTVSG